MAMGLTDAKKAKKLLESLPGVEWAGLVSADGNGLVGSGPDQYLVEARWADGTRIFERLGKVLEVVEWENGGRQGVPPF